MPTLNGVYVICRNCGWKSSRVNKGCDSEHLDDCSCSFGLCNKCGGWMASRSRMAQVRRDGPEKPEVEGVRIEPIPWAPGYCAGDDGSIWTCLTTAGEHDLRRWKRMRFSVQRGHYGVILHVNRRQRLVGVHRLILEAFVGPPPQPGMHACHFPDPDPTNNRLSNLRWGTPAENVADAIVQGVHPLGVKHGMAKLTDEDVRLIRRLHADGRSVRSLSKEYEMMWSSIDAIVKRRHWKHVD